MLRRVLYKWMLTLYILANHDVGLDVLKELLGHRSVSTTQIYVQTSTARLKEAVSHLRR